MRQFLRRVHPSFVIFDKNQDKWRASSATFRDQEMSCDDEGILTSLGRDWHSTLEGYDGFSLVRLPQDVILRNGQSIKNDPIVNDLVLPDNLAHVLVVGPKGRPVINEFQKASVDVLIIPPEEDK